MTSADKREMSVMADDRKSHKILRGLGTLEHTFRGNIHLEAQKFSRGWSL